MTPKRPYRVVDFRGSYTQNTGIPGGVGIWETSFIFCQWREGGGGGGQRSIRLARMCVSKGEENGSLSFASSE